MFQTLSPRAGDAIHPVLLGRVWLVRLVKCMQKKIMQKKKIKQSPSSMKVCEDKYD
jgi:hypothetical protein